MSTYVWTPTPDHIENANVTRLARAHGLDTITQLRERSTADIAWYWDAAITDLGIPFATGYDSVLDTSGGIEFPEWFTGGTFNVVDACIGRWVAEGAGDRPAVIHEAEDGAVTILTYAELADRVSRVAAGLVRLGVREGDAVGIYLPMIPEAVIACYAVAGIGAILVPLFSGFAAPAIASRLNDAEVAAVIVADGTIRRGRGVGMAGELAKALRETPSVRAVVAVNNVNTDNLTTDRQADLEGAAVPVTPWRELLDDEPHTFTAFGAMHTLMLGYTSGTTGKPKGAVHTHAGFTVKVASEVAYSFDVKAGDVFCWITDMGWVMGPLSALGTHANGATLVLYEGSPDTPDPYRLWDLVQRHRITMLGVSPTLIRALKSSSPQEITGRDLSSVRTLGSTGEPWDPDSYDWLADTVFGGRVPVINFSGGTEVGGSFLAPYPVEPIPSCSLGGPSLGMDVDVVDDEGNPLRGSIGELVCRQPWPAMTRGVWRDNERYLQSYWSTFEHIWCHGDYALIDGAGQWFILGRSDDVMNVAGKRLAPAEVESVLTTHPAVAEAAAVGIPDPKKGETVWAFWVPNPGSDTEGVSDELRTLVAAGVGKPFAPSKVWQVEALPKTRSAKILRRAVRAAAIGSDPGDLSSAENPQAVAAIADVVHNTGNQNAG
ncbi:AMP-binding protein [Gordonia pseudamarae]|jgi:acetyl-CoA synthetase|uniref:acetate--CoA ligase n=1 Tax=Gordonia pseudamarae TaxID=2831662 RepID=A0ABX6ILZ2_9ACTN|nr:MULTISPECIES: AMP-binding protein [Gordonia]MBD0020792.1 AMP-binding protein [Gordonia sp. (in: high G+C Gram-positive bacteria)]QHN27824.1 AMP-binding protein [Gordonia pseudamarae]QHN36706.1 AMP-binding protein [Gordonia pseudamarae]